MRSAATSSLMRSEDPRFRSSAHAWSKASTTASTAVGSKSVLRTEAVVAAKVFSSMHFVLESYGDHRADNAARNCRQFDAKRFVDCPREPALACPQPLSRAGSFARAPNRGTPSRLRDG